MSGRNWSLSPRNTAFFCSFLVLSQFGIANLALADYQLIDSYESHHAFMDDFAPHLELVAGKYELIDKYENIVAEDSENKRCPAVLEVKYWEANSNHFVMWYPDGDRTGSYPLELPVTDIGIDELEGRHTKRCNDGFDYCVSYLVDWLGTLVYYIDLHSVALRDNGFDTERLYYTRNVALGWYAQKTESSWTVDEATDQLSLDMRFSDAFPLNVTKVKAEVSCHYQRVE